MGRVYSHFALTLSGTLLTLFQHCDFVSSLQDVFEERDYDLGRCNLVITGDGVAIIQYRYSCHLSGVPRRRWSVGAEPAPHPLGRRTVRRPKGCGAGSAPSKSATETFTRLLHVVSTRNYKILPNCLPLWTNYAMATSRKCSWSCSILPDCMLMETRAAESNTRCHRERKCADIQLAHCRFPVLAISNAKIGLLIYFSNKIYGSNFI